MNSEEQTQLRLFVAEDRSQFKGHGGILDRPSDIPVQEKFPHDQPLDQRPE
jgi:hypothetical protein